MKKQIEQLIQWNKEQKESLEVLAKARREASDKSDEIYIPAKKASQAAQKAYRAEFKERLVDIVKQLENKEIFFKDGYEDLIPRINLAILEEAIENDGKVFDQAYGIKKIY